MSKLSNFWVGAASLMVLTFSNNVHSKDAVELACFGGAVDTQASHALFRLGENIRDKVTTLTLPADCIKAVKAQGNRSMPNPYVAALETAADMKTTSQFAQDLGELIRNTASNDTLSRAITDHRLVTYMRIACGTERECVKDLVQQIPDFHPEKSPVFCDFESEPDAAVIDFFKSSRSLQMDIACLRHSTGNKDLSLSPLDNWFNAFENLGENDGR